MNSGRNGSDKYTIQNSAANFKNWTLVTGDSGNR